MVCDGHLPPSTGKEETATNSQLFAIGQERGAYRSHHDAVLESYAPQLQWLKELRRVGAIWLGI